MFTCQSDTKAMKDCRMDYDTYECYYCANWASDGDLGYTMFSSDDETFVNTLKVESYDDSPAMISLCGVYPQSARGFNIPQTKEECLGTTNTKPSLGTDGRFCQCTKPNAAAVSGSNRVSLAELRAAQNALAEIDS